jgi:hypothetical protein
MILFVYLTSLMAGNQQTGFDSFRGFVVEYCPKFLIDLTSRDSVIAWSAVTWFRLNAPLCDMAKLSRPEA